MQKDKEIILRYLFSFLTGLLCIFSDAHAQSGGTDGEIVNAFNLYRSQYIQEKLFVHTDKDTYVSREILWFRIYYVNAFYNSPASVSKIAYVEILDKNNQPVVQQKVSLKPGESNGSIIIPVNITSGTYRLRAYTSWMKNFSPDYFFEKPIRIINPQDLQPQPALSKTARYDIQFFPEGGNLVQHIETKVGFRITDAYGKGLDCEGILLNSNSDTILTFHPKNLGLGNFVFTPAGGLSYKAVIRFPHGEEVTKDLPASSANGYVMNISNGADGQITAKIKVSADLNGQGVYLFVHGSHSFLPVKHEKLSGNQADILINPGELEDGISRVTLFSETGQPVCERLYFKYPHKKILISAETNPEYTTRGKINLNLAVTDTSGKPVPADMSLAVYRLDSLEDVDESDILNYLYLTSELGPVENPAFYFNGNGISRNEDMDNLMLTHGWRRFIWKDLLEHKSPAIQYPPEHGGHIIKGKLVDNNSGAAVPGVSSFLSVPSTRTEFRITTSDSDGIVKFEIPGFYGSQEIILQTNPKEDSTCHVEINSPFSDKYSTAPLPEYAIPPKNSLSLLDESIAEQVQHIYRGARLNQFSLQSVDTNSFYVEPDEKYILDNFTRFQTMEEVIREYVVSTNVKERKEKFKLLLANKPQKTYFETGPLILIDGVPFFDDNELFQQDPMRIRRLDLVNREYSLGLQYFSGIVSLTTYHGDLNGILMNTRPLVLDYPGIPEQREFFSPAYETEDQVNSRVPDFRTLLFWAPEIKSENLAKNPVSFYSSDLPGKYAAVIMGLTANGEPGSRVIYFNVKR